LNLDALKYAYHVKILEAESLLISHSAGQIIFKLLWKIHYHVQQGSATGLHLEQV
jgi:hypothetical protein